MKNNRREKQNVILRPSLFVSTIFNYFSSQFRAGSVLVYTITAYLSIKFVIFLSSFILSLFLSLSSFFFFLPCFLFLSTATLSAKSPCTGLVKWMRLDMQVGELEPVPRVSAITGSWAYGGSSGGTINYCSLPIYVTPAQSIGRPTTGAF